MNKYERLRKDLDSTGTGQMKVFGNSMLPIIKSGSLLTYTRTPEYEVGDIVFCKVMNRMIDAHKIILKDSKKGYLIANNAGYENGWTWAIFAKVTKIN